MARKSSGGRRADEERRRRLTETLDSVIAGPPYPHDLDPLSVSRAVLERLPKLTELSKPQAKRLRDSFDKYVSDLARYRERLDPVRDPDSSFDPANPDTVGRLVVIALLAQDRVPLAEISPTYGSGVYAIYYIGDHSAYDEISRTETPIYVGKADPDDPSAASPREQGPRLFGRLAEHRESIKEVEAYAKANDIEERLRVADFECRRLVCATNAQLVAESHLIGYFKPAWNRESKICFGIGKHGDAATTRRNKKSPWDVLHPGRSLAMDSPVREGMTPETVRAALAAHFSQHQPVRDQEAAIEVMLDAFRQVGRAPADVSAAAEQTDEVEAAMARNAAEDDAASQGTLDIEDTD